MHSLAKLYYSIPIQDNYSIPIQHNMNINNNESLKISNNNGNSNNNNGNNNNKYEENIIRNFGYGYLAGMAGIVSSHPFDTIKTNIQKKQMIS